MSLPELPNTRNPRELRKALLRLRMEMHRQETVSYTHLTLPTKA